MNTFEAGVFVGALFVFLLVCVWRLIERLNAKYHRIRRDVEDWRHMQENIARAQMGLPPKPRPIRMSCDPDETVI